ncbi:hypothetical protein ACA910_001561 [Epithemia clementina (nom. ined.)]
MPSPNKKARKTPAYEPGRSVVDFLDDSELKQALQTVTPQGIASNDWILPVPDPDANEQTVEGELARLRTLQSYFVLDAEPDPAFDRLTQEAREIFGVPTSLISLVDLGRQYLFSNTGAEPVRQTPRDVAFCSHTILNKSEDGVLIVEDTIHDSRFVENPLVTQAPHLRFYAGASLISPEGHRLGTFCVEGPQPRSFSEEDRRKLKEYAATAMNMMVQRRRDLRDRLSGTGSTALLDPHNHLLRHAAVTTNLGDAIFSYGDSITAMKLFQESVQTIMQASAAKEKDEGKSSDEPPKELEEGALSTQSCEADLERHNRMVELLRELKADQKYTKQEESVNVYSQKNQKKLELMSQVQALFETSKEGNAKCDDSTAASTSAGYSGMHPHDGIPGLFNTVTKLKGVNAPRPLPPLVFDETFLIDMSGTQEEKAVPTPVQLSIDERPFTVSMGECSKATLFNMGLIHYHWCRPDTALQFFHLAASVSHKFSPLKFDPVDLCSMNNMAQIHLLLRKPDEALAMLNETLNRGNATLEALYKTVEQNNAERVKAATATSADSSKDQNGTKEAGPAAETAEDDEAEALALLMAEEENDEAARKTRRLRRKLARTLLDIGHVHFFNNDLDKALARCREAITLVDDHMSGVTLAAAWYNLSLVLHHQGHNSEALSCLENFCRVATSNQLIGKDHVQFGDAYQLKGAMLFDLTHYQECVEPLKEALRIRQLQFGPSSGILVETFGLLGKAYLALEQVDLAIDSLTQCLEIERQLSNRNAAAVSTTTTTLNANGKRDAPTEDTADHTSLSFEAAQTMLDLGRAYQIKGNVSEARLQYGQVHDWAKAFFGADHAFPARIAGLLEKLSQQQQQQPQNQQPQQTLVAH